MDKIIYITSLGEKLEKIKDFYFKSKIDEKITVTAQELKEGYSFSSIVSENVKNRFKNYSVNRLAFYRPKGEGASNYDVYELKLKPTNKRATMYCDLGKFEIYYNDSNELLRTITKAKNDGQNVGFLDSNGDVIVALASKLLKDISFVFHG